MCEFLTGDTCKIDLEYCAVPRDHACGKRVRYKADRSPKQPACVPVVLNDLLSAAFHESFEEIHPTSQNDIGFSGQFIVDGIWYSPRLGCYSMQHFLDMIKGS